MALLDYYEAFSRTVQTCNKCGWAGLGSDMDSGESFGDGVEKVCPVCGKRWGFVQYSVTVADDAPADWKANIGRVAD